MSDDTSKFPRDIAIDEEEKRFYELSEEYIFKSQDAPMKSVFMYALALGWSNKKRKPLKKRKGTIPSSTLSDKEKWILYSIAYAETNNIEIILNGKEVANIAEEYANGGIEYLYSILRYPYDTSEDYNKLLNHIKSYVDKPL